jgi:acylphosphatase
MSKVARRLVIRGDVQGVGFRENCRRAAGRAGVGGWVRNRADGTVEAWLEGDVDAVGRLVTWCRHGPSWATVTGVDVSEEAPVGVEGFRVM